MGAEQVILFGWNGTSYRSNSLSISTLEWRSLQNSFFIQVVKSHLCILFLTIFSPFSLLSSHMHTPILIAACSLYAF